MAATAIATEDEYDSMAQASCLLQNESTFFDLRPLTKTGTKPYYEAEGIRWNFCQWVTYKDTIYEDVVDAPKTLAFKQNDDADQSIT
jgi:hypothetical protein